MSATVDATTARKENTMRAPEYEGGIGRGTMLRVIIAAAIACIIAGASQAQTWPTRPVTMVVPFPAGGPVDLVGRIFSQRLSETLGQQVIVENIGGAGGATGAARVAKAPADGSTFLFGNQATHTFSQLLYKKPLYNAVADFAPSTVVIENSKLLVTRKNFPANTLAEFIAHTKANHASLQYGSAGAGSATHITCVLLNMAIGVQVTHVPYRGTGPAMQDVIAGRIDYICDVISTSLPLVRADSVKALAMLSPARSPVMPELPTAHEQGLKDFDGDGWNAFFFPKGTPEPIVRRLAQATSDVLDVPAVRERLEGLGLNVPPPERRTPEYLARLVRSELDKWAAPVKASGAGEE
jgi:tripartite-type tricarboxylate transporter receptor subunit TctC